MNALGIVRQYHPNVLFVQDTDKSLEIEVMQDDSTKKGIKKHKICALAQACKRTFNVEGVIVARSVAYLVNGVVATRYRLPQSVVREIVAFDRGGKFSPGLYLLATFPKSSQLGARVQYSGQKAHGSGGKNQGKMKKRFQHITTGIRSVLNSSL